MHLYESNTFVFSDRSAILVLDKKSVSVPSVRTNHFDEFQASVKSPNAGLMNKPNEQIHR